MDIKIETLSDIAIAIVEGELNMNNSGVLRDFFKDIIKNGSTKVLIDFEKVSFIDSSGIATLIELFQSLEKVGGLMRLCHVNKMVLGVLEITKVHKLFGIYANREEALRDF